MSAILDEIRAAYEPLGVAVEGVATYGTYYRLRCARCGAGWDASAIDCCQGWRESWSMAR